MVKLTVLNLGHQKFADTEKTGPGGDLVAVTLADAGGGKGHSTLVKFEKLGYMMSLLLETANSDLLP